MSKKERAPLWVPWTPKDAIDGMEILEPLEELAYRRIIDFIYLYDDNLPDDDRRLARLTKTGRHWKRIKQALLNTKPYPKIEIVDGRITNEKCRETLAKAHQNIAQKSRAGVCSSEARKGLKKKKTRSTAVTTGVATDVPTGEGTIPRDLDSVRDKPLTAAATAAGKVFDPVKRTYDLGRELLTAYGIDAKKQGGLITKWRKAVADDDRELQAIFVDAGAVEREDVIAFIGGAIRFRTKGRGRPVDEDTADLLRRRIKALREVGYTPVEIKRLNIAAMTQEKFRATVEARHG